MGRYRSLAALARPAINFELQHGARAACVVLWTPGDFEWGTCDPAMRRYVETRSCRRRMLLQYFGETGVRCSGCDRCGVPD